MGMLPAGSICNRTHYLPHAEAADGLDPIRLDMMFDAQTSGGLVLAVKPDQLDRALGMLADAGDPSAHVGTAHAREEGRPSLSIV